MGMTILQNRLLILPPLSLPLHHLLKMRLQHQQLSPMEATGTTSESKKTMEVTVALRPVIISLPWNLCLVAKICKVISIDEESPAEECVVAVQQSMTVWVASTETCRSEAGVDLLEVAEDITRVVTAVVLMVPAVVWVDQILLKAIIWCITEAQH